MTKLTVEPRSLLGKQVKTLRKNGQIPAVLYGHGIKSVNIAVDYLTFAKVYKEAGSSSLVDLVIGPDNKSIKVLIQDVTLDPLTSRYQHIDFHQVRMNEKITTEVPIVFVGEAKAVKEQGGILVKTLTKLHIECLPQDLQHQIEVDISSLENFNSFIAVKDLSLPSTWKVLDQVEEAVVGVEPPRSEEELAKLKEQVSEDVSKVEKVEGKKDEESTEETKDAAKESADKKKE